MNRLAEQLQSGQFCSPGSPESRVQKNGRSNDGGLLTCNPLILNLPFRYCVLSFAILSICSYTAFCRKIRRLLPHRELSSSPRSVFDQAACRLSSGKAPLIRSPFFGHISAASDKAAPGSGSFSVFLLKRSASCLLQLLPE